jgi:hypothetical protein
MKNPIFTKGYGFSEEIDKPGTTFGRPKSGMVPLPFITKRGRHYEKVTCSISFDGFSRCLCTCGRSKTSYRFSAFNYVVFVGTAGLEPG